MSKRKTAKPAEGSDAAGPGDDRGEPNLSDVILAYMLEVTDLFHDDRSIAYAEIHHSGRAETVRLRSPRFVRFIIGEVHRTQGRAISKATVETVVGALEAIATFDRPEQRVHVRVGEREGRLYVDLGGADGSCVEIADGTWDIVASSPIRFTRPDGMRALPRPIRGGTINALRQFLSLSEQDFILLVGWLVASFRGDRPCPVLVLTGHQGSGKSSATRIIKTVADPSAVPLRSPPRTEEDLVISALNARVIALENVSAITADMSDALCRLVTGGGIGKRTLYTNDGETALGAMRAIVMNGIGSFISRPDLAERCLVLRVRDISDENREQEAVLFERLAAEVPAIFASLLDGVAAAHLNWASVQLRPAPRMADFAAWIIAASPGLGLSPEAMEKAYTANRARAILAALESSPVAMALQAFLEHEKQANRWEGTARDLHRELGYVAGNDVVRSKYWPRLANHFTAQLRRDDTFLRTVGIEVTFLYRGHTRWMKLRRRPSVPSAPSATPGSSASAGAVVWTESDDPDATDDGSRNDDLGRDAGAAS